jgi:hypothetical protein
MPQVQHSGSGPAPARSGVAPEAAERNAAEMQREGQQQPALGERPQPALLKDGEAAREQRPAGRENYPRGQDTNLEGRVGAEVGTREWAAAGRAPRHAGRPCLRGEAAGGGAAAASAEACRSWPPPPPSAA